MARRWAASLVVVRMCPMSFSTMVAPTGASWRIILPAAITKVFSIDDEEVLDALISESDELAHVCNFNVKWRVRNLS